MPFGVPFSLFSNPNWETGWWEDAYLDDWEIRGDDENGNWINPLDYPAPSVQYNDPGTNPVYTRQRTINNDAGPDWGNWETPVYGPIPGNSGNQDGGGYQNPLDQPAPQPVYEPTPDSPQPPYNPALVGVGAGILGNMTNNDNIPQWLKTGLDILPGVFAAYQGQNAARSSERAAELEALSKFDANQIIRDQYDKSEANLKPWQSVGEEALDKQRDFAGVGEGGLERQQAAYDNFRESPGVAWRREQAMKAINRDSAAMGGLGGANRLKALQDRATNLAEQSFGNYWNQLGSLSGMGLNAGQAMAGVGGTAAAGQAMYTAGAGSDRAQGVVDSSQARLNGNNQGLGFFYNYLTDRNR